MLESSKLFRRMVHILSRAQRRSLSLTLYYTISAEAPTWVANIDPGFYPASTTEYLMIHMTVEIRVSYYTLILTRNIEKLSISNI